MQKQNNINRFISILFFFTFCFFANTYNSIADNNDVLDYKYDELYDEKNDNNIYGNKTQKNYAKIGNEIYSQEDLWEKFYVGFNVNWVLHRFGDHVKRQIAHKNFFRRFQNFDIYGGMRVYQFLGIEYGYTHLGNFTSKTGKKHSLDGGYVSAQLYSPMLDLKYTTVEGYLSLGTAGLFGGANKGKIELGGKAGLGFLLHLYGSVAINCETDYYYVFSSFSRRGFIAFKTGVSFYLNI